MAYGLGSGFASEKLTVCNGQQWIDMDRTFIRPNVYEKPADLGHTVAIVCYRVYWTVTILPTVRHGILSDI